MISPKTKQFILDNINQDLVSLALKANKFPEIDIPFAISQIYGMRKAKEKLPTWLENEAIVFPPKISMEQCSSEQTAKFKASLVSGNRMADLTGGFGIDSFFFSKKVTHFDYFERYEKLGEIVEHNFKEFGIDNVDFYFEDGMSAIQQKKEKYDWVFLDPARRGENQKKVVGFEDCEPNVLDNLEMLLQKSESVLLKASPRLDIKQAVRQINSENFSVEHIWIVALQNECKELLFKISSSAVENPELEAVNIMKNGKVDYFTGSWKTEMELGVSVSNPKEFLYEPNSAIMKSGLFNTVGNRFNLSKIHAHSHLFFSDEFIGDFPGRVFKCTEVLKFNKKEILKRLPNQKANITVRNFPLTVAEIRKKTGIKDGGEKYIFATTDADNSKIMLLCEKI
jgi:16S rRNA G966 N2-methylase RsmD